MYKEQSWRSSRALTYGELRMRSDRTCRSVISQQNGSSGCGSTLADLTEASYLPKVSDFSQTYKEFRNMCWYFG